MATEEKKPDAESTKTQSTPSSSTNQTKVRVHLRTISQSVSTHGSYLHLLPANLQIASGVFKKLNSNNLNEFKELLRVSPNIAESQKYAKCFMDKTDSKIPAIALKSLVLMYVYNV